MNQISYNGKPVETPENWKELMQNRKLFEYAISLFFRDMNKLQIRILTGLKSIGVSKLDQKRITNVLHKFPDSRHATGLSDNLFRLSNAFLYVTEKVPDITENLFPKLFSHKRLIGSVNILKDFSTWEFALAENYFFEYAETGKETALNNFIAVWYRPRKRFIWFQKLAGTYNGEPRENLNDYGLEERANRISAIPLYKKFLILRFFAHQRTVIAKKFPNTFKTKKVKTEEEFTWADTILTMSQPGDEQKTGNTKLAIILSRIENENISYKKNKSKESIS